ncbi:WYL domain-containing protein [Vitreoscilla massiliensis]|uniref:WYL domain-containing protein n=1 Tax=Vitreoscilla massiliensis TaxID=1689272 RepID=A0ABY4DXP5_9NEIS|nr:WYL domain-containing protein [Vitreoscilla massiliensis]UOO88298.1 WYL domain-containing protein [Vitreoscilla massiliensis]
MRQRTDTLDTTIAYIEILRIIPKTRYISAQDIAEHLKHLGFERDIRSIQRIMNKLCEHFEIECNMQSKPYGYRWKAYAKGLEVPILNAKESLMLNLAEKQLKYLLPANILKSLEPIFYQARIKLQAFDASNHAEQEWVNKVVVAPTSQVLLPAKVDETILDEVSAALFANRWLDVAYRNQTGVSLCKRVMPLALVQQGPTLYLVVQFEGYEDIRHLALHRFLSATMTHFSFERPADFNLQHYQSEGRFGFGTGKKITLRFKIGHTSGFHLTETPLSTDQQILEASQEHYHIQATVYDSEMLDWWLAKFGDDVWELEKIPVDQ